MITITCALLFVAFASLVPAAQAHHGCSFSVGADAGHSPANTWTTHNSPRFTFDVGHCRVHAWEVTNSWGGSFQTGAGDYHPTLGSGVYSVTVRAYYSVDAYNNYWHCHSSWWGCSWHYHSDYYWAYYWSGYVTSPTVKIDVTNPTVDISSIDQPFVENMYVTSDSTIRLSAADAHSGLHAVQSMQDAGAWSTYDASTGIHIVGEDGAHTLGYRATDKVGLVTAKARNFILDNTAPAITIIHPTANSANVDELSAETCSDNARVTNGDEVVAEVPEAPPTPELPVNGEETAASAVAAVNDAQAPAVPAEAEALVPAEAQPAYNDAKSNVPADLPNVPTAPAAVDEGPDVCGGHVVSTLAQSAPLPAEPGVPDLNEAIPAIPGAPAIPALPEAPVSPGDVLPPTVASMVEDALGQVPSEGPAVPGAPTLPTFGTPTDELESAIGPIPADVPTSVGLDAASIDFANPVVLTGAVEMSANVNDATVGTALVEFIVDDVVRSSQSAGNADYAWTWDTTLETAGEHSFAIRAVDRLGNEDSVEFTVIVVATTPEGIQATADAKKAEAEQAAADAQATAGAAPGEIQAAVDAAPGQAQTAVDAAAADANGRATTLQGYAGGRSEEIIPDDAQAAIDDAMGQVPPV